MEIKKYIKKLSGYSLGPIIGALVSFITIPIITYFISPEEFGRVSMFTLATNLAEMIVYLGLDQAYVKYYYELDKQDVFFNAMLPSLFLSIFVGVIIVIAYKPISMWLYETQDEFLLVIMLAVYLPFSVLGKFNSMHARVSEHAVRYSVFSFLNKVLMLIGCLVFFLLSGKQFQSVIYATTLSQIIAPIIMIQINHKEINIHNIILSKKTIKTLLKFGLPLIPATIVGWVLNSIDKIMIRSQCGYEQLGLYSAALKIVAVLAIVQSCFVAFWTPVAFSWNREKKSIKNFEHVGQLLCFIMSLLFTIILLFKDVIITILSPDYYAAVFVVPFLLLHPIMYTISEVTVVGIYFTGKSSMTIVVALISCIINVLGNTLLIPRYGAVGASVATGVSYCVFFWIRTLISRKVWKKIRIDVYLIYTIYLISLSVVNLLLHGAILYFINAMACIIIVILNIPLAKRFIMGGGFNELINE